MTSVRIDASEVHALADDLRQAADTMPGKAQSVVSKVGHDMQATAQAIVPVDTGHLKSTIGTEVMGLSADVFATAEYSSYVELGTSRMAPQPYLGPAFDQHLPDLESALGALGSSAIL